jgi:hypothetical protein
MSPNWYARFPCFHARDDRIGFRAYRVLHVLYGMIDGSGWCWPTDEDISEGTAIDPRNVRRSLVKLENLGIIERRSRANRRSIRVIQLPISVHGDTGQSDPGRIDPDAMSPGRTSPTDTGLFSPGYTGLFSPTDTGQFGPTLLINQIQEQNQKKDPGLDRANGRLGGRGTPPAVRENRERTNTKNTPPSTGRATPPNGSTPSRPRPRGEGRATPHEEAEARKQAMNWRPPRVPGGGYEPEPTPERIRNAQLIGALGEVEGRPSREWLESWGLPLTGPPLDDPSPQPTSTVGRGSIIALAADAAGETNPAPPLRDAEAKRRRPVVVPLPPSPKLDRSEILAPDALKPDRIAFYRRLASEPGKHGEPARKRLADLVARGHLTPEQATPIGEATFKAEAETIAEQEFRLKDDPPPINPEATPDAT